MVLLKKAVVIRGRCNAVSVADSKRPEFLYNDIHRPIFSSKHKAQSSCGFDAIAE